MIEVFKMIHNKVWQESFFVWVRIEEEKDMVFVKKLKGDVNSNIGLNFFTRRVINYWNQFSDVAVACRSFNIFKMKLDEFMIIKGEF